jgi:hypothetical protein
MSSVHVARQGFITKSALPSVSRVRGSTTVADNKTVLLLNGNGTNGAQNNTFVDDSTNNFSITRNGNATQGSFSPFTLPDGQWSNFFDGTGDYLTIPSGSAFQFGTDDFTIESWVYLNATPTFEYIIDARNSGQQTTWAFAFGLGTSGRLGFFYGTTTILEEASVSVTPHTWVHCAVARSGTTISLFINGTRVATTTDTTNYSVSPTISYIGARFSAAGSMNGYLSNVRTVKGTAVYNPTLTTLTVPTTSLTAITNTSLLTCQSNRFRDNSSNNFAITRNGDVRVTPWSPFAPTSAYDPATNGGSGYFDGTGDFLQTGTSPATLSGDFTIEGWVYINALGGVRPLVCVGDDTQSTGAVFYVSSTGRLAVYGNNTALLTGTTQTVALSSWNHIAFVRSSGTITLYLNGVADSTTASNSTSFAGVYRVGAEFFGGSLGAVMNGYIANFRTVAGTAVYTSAFTPPTAPVTNITNTSLLLNFTNAGIFDTAGDNVIETVGNAQIDTAVKKYGSGSLEFDGSGDYLRCYSPRLLPSGRESFTIEFWMRLNALSSSRTICFWGATSANQAAGVQVLSNGKVSFFNYFNDLESSTTIAINTWYHIAAQYDGNTKQLYIDGILRASASTTAINIATTDTIIVGATSGGGEQVNGYVDDFRLTRGQARYTANFTPPTAELIVYGTSDNIVNNSTYGVYQLA